MSTPLCYSVKCANCGDEQNILKFGVTNSNYDDLDGKPNGVSQHIIPDHCTNCNYVSKNISEVSPQEAIIVNSSIYQVLFDYDKQYSCPTTIILEGRILLLDALGLNLEKSQYLIYLCWEHELINQPMADYYRNRAVESINNLKPYIDSFLPDDIWWLYKFSLDSYRRLSRFTEAEKYLEDIRHGIQEKSEHLTLLEFQEFAIARRDTRNYRTGVLLTDWWKNHKDL